jgi:hypothetical protein
MIDRHGQRPSGLPGHPLVEAHRRDVLESLAIVADDPHSGDAGARDLAGSGGDEPWECREITLGHQALRLLEQERESGVGHQRISG